jgi:CelD/BcsL family acetyltransferase involved in cellulose biosynthesis
MTTVAWRQAAALEEASADRIAIECRIEDSFEALEEMRAEWDDFVISVGGDIYMSYDWCRIWWKHYGHGRRLRIYVFRDGSRLVGIIPIFYERVWLGPVGLKIAKLVGSDFALTVTAPPISRRHGREIVEALTDDLFATSRVDLVSFGPLPRHDGAAIALRDACSRLMERWTGSSCISGAHTVFSLPASFGEYVRSLNKRQQQNYRRDCNLLAREHAIRADVIRAPDLAEVAFESFVRMHAQQWNAQGCGGHFADWPGSVAFNLDLVTCFARGGQFRMYRLLANGQAVSQQYCFQFGDRCFWRLPARAADSCWDRFGLGRLGLIRMIEAVIDEGLKSVEAGVGHYDYKLNLGGREYELWTLRLVSSRPWSRVLAGLFFAIAGALHLLYYRIWFLRIRPRVPVLKRPLWKCWIRSQL